MFQFSTALAPTSVHGACDLNVVIRTAVLAGLDSPRPRLEIAAGGALTALSDVADEWAEVQLKANAVRAALGPCKDGRWDRHRYSKQLFSRPDMEAHLVRTSLWYKDLDRQ